MTSSVDLVTHGRDAARLYSRQRSVYQQCAAKIEVMLTSLLDEEQVNYQSVSARAKTESSFRRKAAKPDPDNPGLPRYQDPMVDVTDLLGARVITYLPETVDRACELIRDQFDVDEDDDKGQRTRDRGVFGYASKHFLVRLRADRAGLPEYKVLRDKVFEIQVRTAAQHAWAEFEHDVRYKVAIPEESKSAFDRRFLLAAALMELADAEFTAIDELFRDLAVNESRTERSRATHKMPRELDLLGLMNWLTERYPDASKSKNEHYAWMLDILRCFELQDANNLELNLSAIESEGVASAMRHRFPAGHVRRLDDDLLARLGERYIAEQPQMTARRREVLAARLVLLQAAGVAPT